MRVWAVENQDDGEQEGAAAYSTAVALDSLGGRILRLNLRKRPGHEDDDVLGEPDDGSSSSEGVSVTPCMHALSTCMAVAAFLRAQSRCIHVKPATMSSSFPCSSCHWMAGKMTSCRNVHCPEIVAM